MAAAAATAAEYVAEEVFWYLVEAGAESWAVDAAVWAASTATTLTINAGLSYGISALMQKPSVTPSSNDAGAFASQVNSRTHIVRTTVANRDMVYGMAMKSGPLVFATSNDNYGTLHFVIALANHECEALTDVIFGDTSLGPLDAGGYPTSDAYYLATNQGGTLSHFASDNQGVNRIPATQFQYNYITLPHAPLTVTITDTGLTTANNPTGTPYQDGGGTWTNVGFDNVAAGMRKNYPSDAGPGYIPWRQFGFNGSVLKLSASSSYGANITITYTTASGKSYLARVRKHLGGVGQVADAELVAMNVGWTDQHRGDGVTYIVASMVYDEPTYPRGIPNIKVLVKGKKLYDPRTGGTAWSDNPALVIRDYLTGKYGLNCTNAEIDDASFVVAAGICDELVAIDQAGTTQKRYTCNGVVDTGQLPPDVLKAMISSCAGVLVFQSGQWRIKAGAYTAPVGDTLTVNDLRASIKVDPKVPRDKLVNAVKGTFIDPDRAWLPQDYPAQRNSTYVAQDAGEEIFADLTLPMTNNNIMAQRLAKMALDRARQGIIVNWPGKPKLLGVCIGDTKKITLSPMGWTDKEFVVIDWSLSETGAVDLVLQEESAASYNWNYGMATTVDAAPDTALPDPWVVPTLTGLTVSSGTNRLLVLADGTIVSRMYVEWAAGSLDVSSTNLRYRRTVDAAWTTLSTTDEALWILPAEDGATYIVQAQYVNTLGYSGAWASVEHTVIGKLSPPVDVASLDIAGTVLAWPMVSDADLAGYVIRFHYGQNFDWASAAPLHTGVLTSSPFDMLTRPAGTVTVMVKAIDTSGNFSLRSANVVTDLGDATIANIVETITLDPTFAGTLTNSSIVGGVLVANATDSFYGTDDQSFYTPDTDPFYEPSGYAHLTWVSSDIIVGSALRGSIATLVMTTQGADLTVEYQATSPGSFYGLDADSFYGPDLDAFYPPPTPWAPWPGQIQIANDTYALRVGIGAGSTQGKVLTLAMVIDAPDIVEDISNLAIGSGGTTIPYTRPFTVIKAVHATLQANLSGAETVEIDKTLPLAPTIKAYNSAHTTVSGATADIQLKGY